MDTKALVNTLASKLNREPADVQIILDKVAEIVTDTITQGDSVTIPGFGTFEPKMRAERVATHPSTGKKLLVPPKLSVVFKPSMLLKQKVRNS